MKSLEKDETVEESTKIVLIGLDNGGKTTILNCLKGNKRISAFNNPMPTKSYEIQEFKALNSKYAVWDLGGQKTYQDEYFINFGIFLKNTDKIIYVIDIQDTQRYEVALKYLEKVVKSIGNQNTIDFSVFLHKFDPDLLFNPDLNEAIINDLIMKIREIFPPKFKYSLDKTTIYAIFEKTAII
jgi:small GTP-binding protein